MRFIYSLRKMAKLFANNGDPDQTPRSAASDLGLHCLPITLLRVSRLQWYKVCLQVNGLIPRDISANGKIWQGITENLLWRSI